MDTALTESIRVLLVEDDELDALRIITALENSPIDFEIQCVHRIGAAKTYVERQESDVVVLDLKLQDGDGLGNLQVIRNQSHEIPVVVISSDEDRHLALKAVRVGAQEYLTKSSLHGGHVVRAVTNAIHRKSTEAEPQERASALRNMAHQDPLTGAYSRRHFHSVLLKAWQSAEETCAPLSCAILDLDHFKRVNDAFGHIAGDTALLAVAEIVLENARSEDLVCRYGGEEFLILLPDVVEQDAMSWVDQVRVAIADAHLSNEQCGFRVTASAGVAEGPAGCDNAEHLIDLAEQAQLVSKECGGNRTTAYSSLEDVGTSTQLNSANCASLKHASASDYMTSPIRCLRSSDSITQVIDQLLALGLNSMPVVDHDGRLVGIVSEKDLIDVGRFQTDLRTPISKIMNSAVVAFEVDTPLDRIREFLARVSMRRVVIVDQKRPVGVLSRSNLLRHLRDQSQQVETCWQ